MNLPVYKPRVVDPLLTSRLQAAGAVLIEGPKACGKTETARRAAASEVHLDVDISARQAAAVDPSLVLVGDTPRLIDEWQLEPSIWNHVRHAVDERQSPGQFILTGSAVPVDDATRHSGAGRFSRLRMRPMSLHEGGLGTGAVSLTTLLEGRFEATADPGLGLADVAEEIARGGWPATRELALEQALQANRDYLEEIRRTDISAVDGVSRDPEKVGQLLRSLARHVSTSAAAKTLARDVGGAAGPLHEETAAEYLRSLARLFVVEDQPAWGPHLRSRNQLRSAAKRHFVDPSLAVAALHSGPGPLLGDLGFLGLLFESLVIRDLRVLAEPSQARVLHYRDNKGYEADAIVTAEDGRWAAFEVKLGGEALIEEAAASLSRFLRQIDTAKCGEPATLGVIVATGYGYERRDGIKVIPLGALAP